MGKNRDYVVCASCGDASWQYAYRARKKEQVTQGPSGSNRGLGVSPSEGQRHDWRSRLESAGTNSAAWSGGMELLSRPVGCKPRAGKVAVGFG